MEDNGVNSQNAVLRKKITELVKETVLVQLLANEIVACDELPAIRDERVKLLLLSLLNNAVKRDVMMDMKNLKGTTTYPNEQLLQTTTALFKKARDLRRNRHIDSTWTYNGKVFQYKVPICITSGD